MNKHKVKHHRKSDTKAANRDLSPFGDNPLSWKKLGSALSLSPSGLNLAAREEELENADKDFILNGLQNVFDIIDSDAYPPVVECENHMSARPGSPSYKEATAQVLKEIGMGYYI